MRFEDRLQSAYESYICFYRAQLCELKSKNDNCVAELLVQPNGAQNSAHFSLLRIDVIYGGASNPHPIRITAPPTGSFDFEEFEHCSVKISLSPISWENASFSFEAPDFQINSIRDWLSKWIDDKETKFEDAFGLTGVMHSISWNSSGAISWKITIDFGSAPIACAVEFIELLGYQGVSACRIEYIADETET